MSASGFNSTVKFSASTCISVAASRTVSVIGPAVSCQWVMGMIPLPLMRPTVGLNPTMPQALAGLTMEPFVSVPIAAGASPAATAAAEPELERA